jgi:hypothetical protein
MLRTASAVKGQHAKKLRNSKKLLVKFADLTVVAVVGFRFYPLMVPRLTKNLSKHQKHTS